MFSIRQKSKHLNIRTTREGRFVEGFPKELWIIDYDCPAFKGTYGPTFSVSYENIAHLGMLNAGSDLHLTTKIHCVHFPIFSSPLSHCRLNVGLQLQPISNNRPRTWTLRNVPSVTFNI